MVVQRPAWPRNGSQEDIYRKWITNKSILSCLSGDSHRRKRIRKFNDWLGKMRPSINNYDYYVDFEKFYANVDAIRVGLNIMNSLIGSKNVEEDFKALIKW